jgi:hypothetical protein
MEGSYRFAWNTFDAYIIARKLVEMGYLQA